MPFLDELEFRVASGTGWRLVIELTEPLRYVDRKGRLFYIPRGFQCDLSSVPRIFHSFSLPWHVSARSGTLHDAGYRWFEIWKLPRDEMDELMRLALISDDAPEWRARGQWLGVRVGGWRAWNRWRETPAEDKGVKPPYLTRV